MVKVTWERFELEGSGNWEIKSRDFETQAAASRFIQRIRQNVQVNRIWCNSDY